jgi:predicted ATP-dependent serine protease
MLQKQKNHKVSSTLQNILSQLKEKNIVDLEKIEKVEKNLTQKTSPKSAFAARLTLSGNLRLATSNQERLETAKKLGFVYNPNIQTGELKQVLGM